MKLFLVNLFGLGGLGLMATGLWWLHPAWCLVVMGTVLFTIGGLGATR